MHRASVETVFACLTEPEHLTHFWGPAGTHTPLENIVVDLRPGGAFETTMVNDTTGDTYTMRAVYVAVEAPRFLSWRERDSGVLTEVTFADLGDGTTEVVTTQRGLPPHMRTPEARAGWGTALDRAAAYIAALTRRSG
nr:SRPBCC domain-containing protein [Actinoplanes deccanensis]